jgi:hypothetical protein
MAPASDGGSPITSYTVIGGPGPLTVPATGAPMLTISGLTAGTVYSFMVEATNAIGTGPASAPASVIPVFQPAFPNNTGSNPTILTTVNCGLTITGNGANTTGTHAWYAVTFSQAVFPNLTCTLTISLNAPPGDLFDVHPGMATATASATQVVNFSTTTGGTYFIDVSGGTAGNSFSLVAGAH